MKKNVFIILCCFFITSVFSHELLDTFNKSESFKRSHIGIHIVEIKTGKEIFSYNADQFFTPASLQKIPLSVMAIALLREDYHFKTELEYDGKIIEGILHGNVWIKGGGDPTLSMDILDKWEKKLRNEGIEQIDGKIIVDSSCFESTLASPYWCFQDLGNYYAAGACGFTINQNLYRITFKPGAKEGDSAQVLKIDPPIPDLIYHNEVVTGPIGSGDGVYVYGTEYSNIQFYRGTVPLEQPTFTIKATIPDSSNFCGKSLCNKIKTTHGVVINRDKTLNHHKRKLLYRNESVSLKQIIKKMNLHSINIYAESLLKTIGDGNAEQGSLKIEQFLKEQGIPSQIRDGSGLARNNLLTPKGFVKLLCLIRNTHIYQSIYDSFPEIGKSGTLKGFTPISNATIKAKTGSMSNIYNLGGYITLSSGKEYAFCIFCNNYQGSVKDIKIEMSLFLNKWVNRFFLK